MICNLQTKLKMEKLLRGGLIMQRVLRKWSTFFSSVQICLHPNEPAMKMGLFANSSSVESAKRIEQVGDLRESQFVVAPHRFFEPALL